MMASRLRIAALGSLLVACAQPRFAALGPGNYFCQADVVTNTCGPDVPTSSMTLPIDGVGTDLLYVPAPSATAFATGTWTPIQFGTEPTPTAYSATATANCGAASFDYTVRAQLTTLSTDHVDVDLTYDDTGIYGCHYAGVTADVCRLEYHLSCTLR